MREVYCVVVLIAKAVSEVQQKMLKNTKKALFLHFFSKIFGHVFGLRPRILRRSCIFGRRLGLNYV